MTELRMPSLGADMTEGRIVEWLVQPGDEVHRGDIVAIVETEKADLEVEVWHDAVIAELVAAPGDVLAVGDVMARLPASGEVADTGATETDQSAADREEAPPPPTPPVSPAPQPPLPPVTVPPTSPVIRHLAEELQVDLAELAAAHPGQRVHRDEVEAAAAHVAAPAAPTGRPSSITRRAPAPHRAKVSPRARRLAASRGIDPATLTGTGPHGSVVAADVERAPAPRPAGGRRSKAERVAARQRAIGELMSRSWREIPHYRLARRIDCSALLAWLDEHNAGASVDDRIVPAAALLRATALAAAAVPAVNGTFVDGAHQPSEHVDLGVVVALREGGLVTPRIEAADTKPLLQVMSELRDLVTRARAGRLRASEASGATLTVTNLGDLGVDEVHGVIFPPQVALVGFGAITDEPWVVDGELCARPTVHATLAGDHRVSDGRVGAQMLITLERLLKEPASL